jgi:hypothetical protein
MDPSFDSDFVLERFQRLMRDVRLGDWRRNSFAPWEIELLLDIAGCDPEIQRRRALLDRYQKAVERRLANHCELPMKLSEYIAGLKARQHARQAAQKRRESVYASAVS